MTKSSVASVSPRGSRRGLFGPGLLRLPLEAFCLRLSNDGPSLSYTPHHLLIGLFIHSELQYLKASTEEMEEKGVGGGWGGGIAWAGEWKFLSRHAAFPFQEFIG